MLLTAVSDDHKSTEMLLFQISSDTTHLIEHIAIAYKKAKNFRRNFRPFIIMLVII